MTISDKIFELIKERGMTQKEFAQKTGISQSSISDWKRKKTNPVSEKILIICETLGVTPYELLSGTEGEGKRSSRSDLLILDTCGDRDVDGARLSLSARAAALAAGIVDDFTRAAAGVAGALRLDDSEGRALVDGHSARAAAGGTGFCLGARRRACAVALVAGCDAGVGY